MNLRIVEERDANGRTFNYQLQQRVFFMWFPIGSYSKLEHAREAMARLRGSKTVVEDA